MLRFVVWDKLMKYYKVMFKEHKSFHHGGLCASAGSANDGNVGCLHSVLDLNVHVFLRLVKGSLSYGRRKDCRVGL